MRVQVQGLTKRFGPTAPPAVDRVTLEIQPHELFFLLGPSGCGKTTLLRLLAGFYQPDEGAIFFGDKAMQGVPPHQRNTGMVFQNYALWPHMTVEENVAYGLEVRGLKAAARRERVAEALAIVRMEDLSKRTPNQLSGGQQQRVALARALVIQPDLLLLDEPLSNLDARLRLEMRDEIRRIHGQTRITTVYVTHDQKEALSLASRLAVMRQGTIEQLGEPRAIYRSPANRFVADFIGETNWYQAELRSTGPEGAVAITPWATFHVSPAPPLPIGAPVWLGFRPESVRFGNSEFNQLNQLEVTVAHTTYLGDVERYGLEVRPGTMLQASEQNPLLARATGSRVTVHVRPQDFLVLAREGGERG